jgi:hypothetical protein
VNPLMGSPQMMTPGLAQAGAVPGGMMPGGGIDPQTMMMMLSGLQDPLQLAMQSRQTVDQVPQSALLQAMLGGATNNDAAGMDPQALNQLMMLVQQMQQMQPAGGAPGQPPAAGY